jgi:hypothetical protein
MEGRKEAWWSLVHLFVLFGFAVAQPLFDLLSRNAEFFVARRSQPIDIILLTVLLCVGLPAILVCITAMLGWVSHRTRTWVHGCIVALLVAAIALPALKRIDLPGALLVIGASVLGIVATVSYQRFSPARLFLTALSPALLIFPGFFLFSSPVFKVVFVRDTTQAAPTRIDNPPPIVMVIFDEFPVTALLDEQRQIDPIRYPHFAAFAQDAIWFRNATSVSADTLTAVPAILTGIYPDRFRLPTAADYPRSLFTLLSSVYEFKVFETRTQLCPEKLCRDDLVGHAHLMKRVSSLISDLAVVYLHLLCPSVWRTRLPAISQDWMNFAGAATQFGEQASNAPRLNRWVSEEIQGEFPPHRAQQFLHFIETIHPSERPTLYFLHVLLPHTPYLWLPSGKQYTSEFDLPGLESERWSSDEWAVVQSYQRLLLQVGFIDMLLAQLIDHLKSVDLYEPSLVIITADHGVSFRPGDLRRQPTKTNLQDLMPIPLFIKTPYQREKRMSDRNVETVDILPTIADILNIPFPWEVDGETALDVSRPERSEKVVFGPILNEQERFTRDALFETIDEALDRKLMLFGSGKTTPDGLFKLGSHQNLIGRHVSEIPMMQEGSLSVAIDHANSFDAIDPGTAFIPSNITGRVYPPPTAEAPLHLAIAVNGTIQAVTRTWTFLAKGERGRWSAIVDERAFRSGSNEVEAFLISPGNAGPVLARTRTATYALSEAGMEGGSILASGEGASFPIVAGELNGWVDSAFVDKDYITFTGWAVDEKRSQLPEWIIMFVNDKFFFSIKPYIQRPDIVEWLGNPAFEYSGFYSTFLWSSFPRSSNLEIRFFALSREGTASELQYVKGYPWRKQP